MADEDRASARAKLVAEAARLKADREASEAKGRAAAAEQKLAEAGFKPRNLRKAFRGEFMFFVALTLMLMGPAVAFVRNEDLGIMGVNPFGLMLAGLGVLLLFWLFSGVLRFRFWRRRLPFALEGWEDALGGQAITEAVLDITYADTRAPSELVAELTRARMRESGDDPVTDASSDSLRRRFFTGPSNFPTWKWARRAVSRVLLEVHRGYPMKVVVLRVVSRGDYDYGSGD
jgi:hypothetical protein